MLSIRSILRPQVRGSVLLLQRSPRCAWYSSSAAAIQAERTIREGPRNDWTRDEIKSVYDSPVLDLLFHGVSITKILPLLTSFPYCFLLVCCDFGIALFCVVEVFINFLL